VTQQSILIVEDNRIVAKDIAKRLERLGYRVAGSVSTGQDAIEKAEESSPDLILMDVRIKGPMDGIDAAQQIQSRFGTPIVYLTAHADEETLSRAKETGPHGYVVKPFEENALRSAIEVGLFKAGMERRLRESERWMRTTLRSIADPTVATDAAGVIRLLNPAASRLTGWSESDAVGQHWSDVLDLLDTETRERPPDPVARALEEGSVVELSRTLLVDRHGSELPIDLRVAPIVDERQTREGLVLVLRDVSEREIRGEALQRSHDLLEAVVAGVGDGILLKSLAGRFLLVNEAAARIAGRTDRELVGSSDSEAFPPQMADQMRRAQQRAVATGTPQSFECSLTGEAGPRWYLVTEAVCRDRGGQTLGIVSLLRDVTELRRDGRSGDTARAVGALAQELSHSLVALEDSLHAVLDGSGDPGERGAAGVEAAKSRIGAVARELASLHVKARSGRSDG